MPWGSCSTWQLQERFSSNSSEVVPICYHCDISSWIKHSSSDCFSLLHGCEQIESTCLWASQAQETPFHDDLLGLTQGNSEQDQVKCSHLAPGEKHRMQVLDALAREVQENWCFAQAKASTTADQQTLPWIAIDTCMCCNLCGWSRAPGPSSQLGPRLARQRGFEEVNESSNEEATWYTYLK